MPHSFGLRARTRDLFSRAFKTHGQFSFTKLMTIYKKGDIVDIIADGAIQRGMPHKQYHGKTGRVFDVNKHAVGIIVNKRVNTRLVPKRIHIRIEHVRKSQSREAFIQRVHRNDELKREAKKAGKKVYTKRVPELPREAHIVKVSAPVECMNPIKFRELY